ncbi:Sigma-24 [Sphingobacterium spiritivorum]|uniref:Sigma-24 n=1 Tax=Sphingobacterium spiritivorum TaxID=258 RepID=A0A380BR39_SPHSI|nr:sigma-70 family RNA polymerase sigma factor [Sphingobacterium spiritivorum]SUJ04565.1 Sigma-24 [Sphingobacterium spiritivorum]
MNSKLSECEIKELFEQNYFGLVEFSWRLVRCEEASRDIVQDVFAKLLRKEDFLTDKHILTKAYLYTMTKNASLNYLRKIQTITCYEHANTAGETSDADVLEALIYAESIDQLYKAIQSLPEACRNICKMTYLEEKSNLEVAEFYGISINTVKTQKKRALELLGKRLSPVVRCIKIFF